MEDDELSDVSAFTPLRSGDRRLSENRLSENRLYHSLTINRSSTQQRRGTVASVRSELPKQQYDLSRLKEAGLKLLQIKPFYKIPNQFLRFCERDPLCDRLLDKAFCYFQAYFRQLTLMTSKLPQEQLDSLSQEKQLAVKGFGFEYAAIVLNYSNYEKTQQERNFFECMFDFIQIVLSQFYKDRNQTLQIQCELGRLLRTDSFNLHSRPAASATPLTSRELWALKRDGDRNSKLITRRVQRSISSSIGSRSALVDAILQQDAPL
mmetsp:Transcript_365/g.615  ORF Transcript_365/g.615 Transcript_365/m.615 type:complete len:264 (+) Transcript_365:114-905(+)|eukprot:CAMPEP_0184661312 /NCGR_PEP_ID=MMETSP0308-20130426/37915_1 /TAXON_ID=38269 /ORGANISM="Gloeochaete witrockiana, Strain SAG 46.84" /LENGTH=263 /DNA_ID=CAMNT_0027102533 /DNA_START=27 /DNA_END=818 /DNA_ORIENTATION=+